MGKRLAPTYRGLFLGIFILTSYLVACSGENQGQTDKKAKASLMVNNKLTVYDVLQDYPGLENFFTYGDMEIKAFEERLFGDFLGNDATADVIVSMKDLFPVFINSGTSTSKIFSSEVEEEMKSKGPIPDFVSTLGVITKSIVNIDESKKEPFYDYLDKLDAMQKSDDEQPGMFDYILNILKDIAANLDTLDDDAVNVFMNFSAIDGLTMKSVEEGKIDYADLDELIEKFATEEPEGLIEVLEGIRHLFYDEELRSTCSTLLNNCGAFLGRDDVFSEIKVFFEQIYSRYDVDSLGEVIERFWTRGPFIGPYVEEMDIERYGADGKQEYVLRELLMHPEIIINALETINAFEREGYSFDDVDDQIAKMIHTDIFCQDRQGDGDFEDGTFYEPVEGLSLKDLSGLRTALFIPLRWNVPFTLTSPWMFELEGGDASKKAIKNLIPEAPKLSIGSLLWVDYYEKDPDKLFGGGKPVTEKKGYGRMRKGVYNAPWSPAMMASGSYPFYFIGEAVYNGPYDNIYDNLKWLNDERDIYVTIDLVQFSEYVPVLKNTVLPFLKLMGLKQLPITLIHVKGARGIIYLELSKIVEGMSSAISDELLSIKMPQWMVNTVVETLKTLLPMGTHLEDDSIVYILSQDVRDSANGVWGLSYFDEKAFYPDRFLDPATPETYKFYYDIRDYSYEKNSDTANPLFNFIAPVCVSAYLTYMDVAKNYPLSMDAVEDLQQAAMEKIGPIYPASYILNILSTLSETFTETPAYSPGEPNIFPLVKLLEPLLSMESSGVIDELLRLVSILGKPELKNGREKICRGIAKLVETIEKDSQSPYTIAAELLEIPKEGEEDGRRWDNLKLSLDYYDGILNADSPYEIVADLLNLMNYLTGVDTTDEEWRLVSEGIVEVLADEASQKTLTRARFHVATIIDEINKVHIWEDAIDVFVELLEDDGILDYIISGMDKDPSVSWDDVMTDADKFIHSELMSNYEEGSFWKDIYELLDFLSEAMEEE